MTLLEKIKATRTMAGKAKSRIALKKLNLKKRRERFYGRKHKSINTKSKKISPRVKTNRKRNQDGDKQVRETLERIDSAKENLAGGQ